MLPLGNTKHITTSSMVLCRRIMKVTLSFLFLFCFILLSAQIITLQEQLTAELEKHGLEYQEVKEALFIRGYDIENMTEVSPDQAEDIRDIIEFLITQKKLESVDLPLQDTIVIDTLTAEDDTLLEEEEPEDDEENVEGDGPKIFGHHLYESGQFESFEPTEDLLAPVDYILGVGDVLVISIFGKNAQFEQEYRINDDGSVRINNDRSKVSVSGLTLNQAERRLSGVFQNFMIFRADEFSLRVRGNKTARIEIFGEVDLPGSYVLSSFNSVFSAIAASGGPTEGASLRNIRLIRSNGEVKLFDLYEWITRPGSRANTYLENGDIIHVPISDFRIEFIGEVRRPMLYDGLEGEGVMKMLEYAGGLTSDAYLNNFQLIRQDGIARSVVDIEYLRLFRSGQTFELIDGDIVTVSAIAEEIENYVRVSGEVRNEGDYQLVPGMKVYDLLEKVKIKKSSRTDIAYLIRRGENELYEIESLNLDEILNDINSSQNLILRNRDELVVYKKSRFIDESYVIVAGAVRFPDTLNHDASGSLRITDYINMSGGLKKEAASFAHVYRINPLNPGIEEYKRVDLKRAFNTPNAVDNIVLESYDSVYVYSLDDFAERRIIEVSGAVNNPGEFEYGQGMTLADAIIMAGGFQIIIGN